VSEENELAKYKIGKLKEKLGEKKKECEELTS
jgi:hypothetical protein